MAAPATICAKSHRIPTTKAANGEINSYAYVYTPPSFGIDEPNSAKLKAVKDAIMPAIIVEMIIAGPA